MNIDPYSSDSSSWSLVDVEDGSDSELDSIGGHLIVESVHDSESESEVEEESEEEVDIAEEALEETEINEEVHNNDEEVDEEADEDVNEEESEAMEEAAAKHFVEPTKVVKKLEELSKSADSPFDKMMDKISATDNAKSFAFVIVVLATLMGAGLGHYIGACLIGDKQFSIEEGSFCLASEKSQFLDFLGNPGLQYQESHQEEFKFPEMISENSDPLAQCEEKLHDANAQIRMKQGVNHFVRESCKQKLEKTILFIIPTLTFHKRVARQILREKYLQQIYDSSKPSLQKEQIYQNTTQRNNEVQKKKQREFLIRETQKKNLQNKRIQKENGTFAPICSLAEGGIMNLTKSIFFSFSNWTSHQPVVQNLIKYTPSFDESLEKVSAWIRNSKGFNNVVKKVNSLAKLPQISNTVFDAVPKKVKEFMRSDLRILATKAISKATTALTERNFSSFSTLVSEYRKSELVKNIRQQVKSALNQLKNFSLSKFSSDVCFAKDSKNYFPKSSEFCSLENCDSASKLATVIEKNSELVIRIGKKRVEEYVRFLKSLSIQNCSKQIQCERDWWMGCGPQFLENCNLQQWQEKRYFSGASLMNRRQDVKRVALDLGWIEQKNRRSSVKCPRLSSAPLPCPAALPLPSILPDSLAPCHPGPNSAKPCQSTIPLPRPCPTNNKFVKPSGDGRPDWFSERAQTRAKQRALQNPRPSKVPRPSKMPQYPQFSKVSVKKSRTLVFSETRP